MCGKTLSLYIHVPFCKKKCDYCHFYVIPDREPFKVDFLEGLSLELEKNRTLILEGGVCSLYFGGGTPSLMGPRHIQSIISTIRGLAKFLPEIEITLEANPEDVSVARMKEFAHAGINRVSVGVQALDDGLLKTLSREHGAQRACEAVYQVKEAGINNISIDLMYDLPGQTLTHWETTLQQALNLPITHLSLYNLVFEQHTVYYKKRNELKPLLPGEETSAAMYLKAIELCKEAGFHQYEISAFGKDGNYSRHNVGYWKARPFLGFGPSAFSYWEGKRYRNCSHLGRYLKCLQKGASPVDYMEQLEGKEKACELLAVNLRLLEGVNVVDFQKEHGPLDKGTLASIKALKTQGLLAEDGSHLKLTQKGLLFYDSIASEII